MKATPVETPLNACARIANTMATNVDQTAASWGDFSKGVDTKRDQLANESLKSVKVIDFSSSPSFTKVTKSRYDVCTFVQTVVYPTGDLEMTEYRHVECLR